MKRRSTVNVEAAAPRAIFEAAAWATAFGLLLASCSGSSNDDGNVTVAGDVPIAYAKRSTAISINPTDGTPFAEGGDLMVRGKSSPSAPEANVTASITQGKGDVSDPEVSYDGKKIVFALRCPTDNTSTIDGAAACTGRWNIWEYDMSAGAGALNLSAGKLRRITSSTTDDDVDPVYLPGTRGFVFSSNRQAKSHLNQALGRSYYALDEYERERVLNLHTMDANGGNVQQISFNQSHDRNPVIRPNGDVMFARWEHVADKNRFAIFRAKPDGTDMFVLYGAQSPGNSFLHPRDMDPAGAYKGFVASSLMPLSRTQEGGALMFIDAANYSEHNTPANSSVPREGGQSQATQKMLGDGRGVSLYGRATAPYPLWDGTNRVLTAYRPCELTRAGNLVPCATLTAAELERLNDMDRDEAAVEADELQDNAPAAYSIYMVDTAKQTWLNVASPPPGFMYTDPVAIQPRAEPQASEPTNIDPVLAQQDLATIEVRSVYDTDGLNRMGEQMLVASDKAGCDQGIATKAPSEALDTRALVADLARMKNPADPAYHCAPARFVRAMRAVAPPSASMGVREAIGETDFEPQQILGYAPIEPDGSFKLQVPADIPLALQVVDAEGRGLQTHTNWIQVRPGERRTCDGCHSPRRGAALNSGAVADAMPAALKGSMTGARQGGETMASTRTRLDPSLLRLQPDMAFTDEWADTSKQGVTARASITLRYTGNTNPADDLGTTVPVNGVINYPEHIQPLWTRDRGNNTCINCHAGGGASRLDLRATMSGTGRLTSYEELMLGDPLLDANGQPVVRIEEGVPMVQRAAPLVETMSGAANGAGQARKSRLTEILFGQTLLAGDGARTAHPNPPGSAPDHATLLNKAEKRLVVEWMDLGGQYYNDLFANGSTVRSVTGLSSTAFAANVKPVLAATCMSGCHQPVGTNSNTSGSGAAFRENRFVLTGSDEGDYQATLAMVSDACNAAANALLKKPSTVPHPAGANGQTNAVLPVGSAGYMAIANWISSGCAR